MAAQTLLLEAIAARAICAPAYLNERIRNFRLWYRDNEPRLSQYWDELGRHCPDGDAADFFAFAVVQHERAERTLLEADCAPLSQREPLVAV